MNVAKIHRKLIITESQFYFANISVTKALIFMKFYVVVNCYLVRLSFKFHDNPYINARTQVINVHARVYSSCGLIYAQIFMKSCLSFVWITSKMEKLAKRFVFNPPPHPQDSSEHSTQESQSFKFHKDLCINALARVVNARAHALSRLRLHLWTNLNEV